VVHKDAQRSALKLKGPSSAAVIAAAKGGTKIGIAMPMPWTSWAEAWQIVATQGIAIRPRSQSRFFDESALRRA